MKKDFPELFASAYESRTADLSLYEGLEYCGPATFKHGEWRTVAKVPKITGGDGQDVEIQECRLPARFYRLIACPGPNSVGRQQKGFVLSTGSGYEMGELIVRIAKEIGKGMIGWSSYQELFEELANSKDVM